MEHKDEMYYVCSIVLSADNKFSWKIGIPMFMNKRIIFDMEHELMVFQEINYKEGNMLIKYLYLIIICVLGLWSVCIKYLKVNNII